MDVYDALATDRPYRKALTPHEAFRVMREEVRRGWWEGALVDEFEATWNGLQRRPAAAEGQP